MANEKRLIDVNKVIDAMQKCIDEAPDGEYPIATYAFQSIIECLKQEPTVDAVEVIRCKDCKYAMHDAMFGGYWCGGGKVKADHFCSYGERRNDEV